jgi:hypothetical protein
MKEYLVKVFKNIVLLFSKHKLSTRIMFFLTGALATIWFLLRVIPKPSRANYPCMKAAAPIMSGFIVYLLSLGGSILAIRKAGKLFLGARYFSALALARLVPKLVAEPENGKRQQRKRKRPTASDGGASR